MPRISHALGVICVQAGPNRSRDRPNRHGGALNAVEEMRKSLTAGTAWVFGLDSVARGGVESAEESPETTHFSSPRLRASACHSLVSERSLNDLSPYSCFETLRTA